MISNADVTFCCCQDVHRNCVLFESLKQTQNYLPISKIHIDPPESVTFVEPNLLKQLRVSELRNIDERIA